MIIKKEMSTTGRLIVFHVTHITDQFFGHWKTVLTFSITNKDDEARLKSLVSELDRRTSPRPDNHLYKFEELIKDYHASIVFHASRTEVWGNYYGSRTVELENQGFSRMLDAAFINRSGEWIKSPDLAGLAVDILKNPYMSHDRKLASISGGSLYANFR